MIYIGCHLSVTNGSEAMGKTMLDFGGNTFAYFTRNPRGGKSKEIAPKDVETPNDDVGYIREIRLVREWMGE